MERSGSLIWGVSSPRLKSEGYTRQLSGLGASAITRFIGHPGEIDYRAEMLTIRVRFCLPSCHLILLRFGSIEYVCYSLPRCLDRWHSWSSQHAPLEP